MMQPGRALLLVCGLLPALLQADDADLVSQVNARAPKVDCSDKLSKEQELSRVLVENRVRAGSIHAAYAEVMTLPPEVAQVALLRADILRRLERAEARAWYVALQKSCLSGQADHGLGLLAAGEGDHATAVMHLQTAARMLPTDARVHNDLGYVYLLLGKDEQAEFELRIASELAPDVRLPAFNLMLLSLLRADSVAWRRWQDRLQPDAREKRELASECTRLHRQRQALGPADQIAQGDPACPLQPMGLEKRAAGQMARDT